MTESPDLMVVRRMASGMTHVMNVTGTVRAVMFGAAYDKPHDGQAACGVNITDAVVMQRGTRVICRPCRHITKIQVAS